MRLRYLAQPLRGRGQPRAQNCQNLPQPQGQRGVDNILRRGPPMDVLPGFDRVDRLAEGGKQRGHRRGISGHRIGHRAGVQRDLQSVPMDRFSMVRRDHAQLRLCLGQGALDQQHRANGGAVGKQLADFRVTEKFAHQGTVEGGRAHFTCPISVRNVVSTSA